MSTFSSNKALQNDLTDRRLSSDFGATDFDAPEFISIEDAFDFELFVDFLFDVDLDRLFAFEVFDNFLDLGWFSDWTTGPLDVIALSTICVMASDGFLLFRCFMNLSHSLGSLCLILHLAKYATQSNSINMVKVRKIGGMITTVNTWK